MRLPIDEAVEESFDVLLRESPKKGILMYFGTFKKDPTEAAPRLKRQLAALDYFAHIKDKGSGVHQIIAVKETSRKLRFPWVNLVLLLLTVGSTLFVGAFYQNGDIPRTFGQLLTGAPFSGSLMAILIFHEAGHFIASRRHGMNVTFPYFIPFPTIIGTLGAVILVRTPFRTRRELLDMGISGPLAGAVVAVIVTLIGLRLSEFVPDVSLESGLLLGNSLLFGWLASLQLGPVPEGLGLVLHPVALAGWIGLFVTAYNLLPISQLDGGHVAYALFGRATKIVSRLVFLALLGMGFLWPGWWLLAVMTFLFKVDHPPPLDPALPLDNRRKVLGIMGLVLLVLLFPPVPLRFVG
jgi:membrane-associated protease RseP (regulator of RpoE activity)